MLSEVSRVLTDNGIFIVITYGDDGSVFDPNKGEVEGSGPRKPILCKVFIIIYFFSLYIYIYVNILFHFNNRATMNGN